MLWAWEQPVDLGFLAGRKDVGVAYLAATAFLDRRGVRARYRTAALAMPQGLYRMPVLRIEGGEGPPDATGLIQICERLIRDGGGTALQIDFDAPRALRPMYGRLLGDLRKTHGGKLFLSMTVLAGWCDEAWFSDFPVDEFVPMLFGMGPAGRGVVRRLEEKGGLVSAACRGSLGYSIDEKLAPRLSSKRRYLFSTAPWSAASFHRHSR